MQQVENQNNGQQAAPLPYYPLTRNVGLINQPNHAPPTDTDASTTAGPQLNAAVIRQAIRRRWFVILVLGLPLGGAAAYGAWMLIPSPYTAFSEIRIRSSLPSVPGSGGTNRTNFRTLKQTHMKLVTSRAVLNTALLSDQKISQFSTLKDEGDKFAKLDWLGKQIRVSNSGDEFFQIALSGMERPELHVIVNAVTDAYLQEVVDKEKEQVRQRVVELESLLRTSLDQLSTKKKDLMKSATNDQQQELLDRRIELERQFARNEFNIMQLGILIGLQSDETPTDPPGESPSGAEQEQPAKTNSLDAYIADTQEYQELNDRITDLNERIVAAEALLAWQKRELSENHPNRSKTELQLKEANEELNSLRERMVPLRKQLMASQQQVSSPTTNPQNREENKLRLKILEASQGNLASQIEDIKKELEDAGYFADSVVESVRLENLTSEIGRQELFAAPLANEITRINAQLTLLDTQPRITHTPAILPAHRDVKKRFAGTGMAGFGVFGFVLAGFVFLDARLQRISSVQQLTERVGLPIIGSVPTIPRSSTSRRNGEWNAKARYWHGVLTESIDSARTILLSEADRNSRRVFMIASSMGGEGKTTVSCHLATSLARTGRRVLLIDGDMRRPFVHRNFDISNEIGLSEILRGEHELSEAVIESVTPGLWILPAGTVDQNALDSLANDRFGELLHAWQSEYDIILIDSPPVLPVTDALLMAQHVCGVIFAVRRDVSRATKVMAACHRLGLLGVPLLGAIAIGLDDEASGYGSDGYRAYGYGPV